MIPCEPRAVISALPYFVDTDPHDRLLVVAFDTDGNVRHTSAHDLAARRPLDEPLLESSMWPDDYVSVAAVAYSDHPVLDLQPLVDAWTYRNRTTIDALWAGPLRWRSYLCRHDSCCPPRGNRYSFRSPVHEDFLPWPVRPSQTWRSSRWNDWQQAIADAERGLAVESSVMHDLALSLHDIPLRDAVLSMSAVDDGKARPAIATLLEAMRHRSTLGAAIPVNTCAAAMRYLDGDVESAALLVQSILDADEYSLARLLSNGLEMRAPASLLARSFSHWNPQDLLMERAA